MPSSSTSSSRGRDLSESAHLRVPADSGRRVLLLALGALVLGLGGWEWFLAGQGIQPRFGTAEPELVAWRMETVVRQDEPQVLFLGSSRTFVDINPEDVGEEAGTSRVSMLTAPGSSSVGLLRPLVDRGGVRGVVIVEVFPTSFYGDRSSPGIRTVEAKLSQASWFTVLEGRALDSVYRLRLFADTGAPTQLAREALQRNLEPGKAEREPASAVYAEHRNGWHELNPNPAFLEVAARDELHAAEMVFRNKPVKLKERWPLLLEELAELDRRAHEGGATLVFVRFPSGGAYEAAEDEVYPDTLYWGRLKRAFPGRAWHFREEPEFRDMALPDGSHLAAKDARRFSRWLGRRIGALLTQK